MVASAGGAQLERHPVADAGVTGDPNTIQLDPQMITLAMAGRRRKDGCWSTQNVGASRGGGRIRLRGGQWERSEVTFATSGGPARRETGGPYMNVAEGRRQHVQRFFVVQFANQSLQGSKLHRRAENAGLRAPGELRKTGDVDGALGGRSRGQSCGFTTPATWSALMVPWHVRECQRRRSER